MNFNKLKKLLGDEWLYDCAMDAYYDVDGDESLYGRLDRRCGDRISGQWRVIMHYSDPMSPKDYIQALDTFYDEVKSCLSEEEMACL